MYKRICSCIVEANCLVGGNLLRQHYDIVCVSWVGIRLSFLLCFGNQASCDYSRPH